MARTRKKEEPLQQGDLRRVTIRMPAHLHAALLQRREETGQPLNDLLVEAAARLVGLPVPQIQKRIPGPKPGRKKGGDRAE